MHQRPIDKLFYNIYLFSEQDIDNLLSGKAEAGINYQAEGPGELLKWDFLNADACFATQSANPPKNKTKVLICDRLSQLKSLQPKDLRFIAALCTHPNYEVYLYQGPQQDLRTAKPINSAQEFWDLQSTIYPATVTQIEALFAKQQISQEGWYMMDYMSNQQLLADYNALSAMRKWFILKNSVVPYELDCAQAHQLDLTQLLLKTDQDIQLLLDSVDGGQIAYLETNELPKNALKKILQHCKEIRKIKFKKCSQEWLTQNIPHLAGSSVRVVDLDLGSSGFTSGNSRYHITFDDDVSVEEVIISGYSTEIIYINSVKKMGVIAREDRVRAPVFPQGEATRIATSNIQLDFPPGMQNVSNIKPVKVNAVNVTSLLEYEALAVSNQRDKILSLWISLEDPAELAGFLQKIKTMAQDFPQLKWLKIDNSISCGEFRGSISTLPYLEYLNCDIRYFDLSNLPKLDHLDLPHGWDHHEDEGVAKNALRQVPSVKLFGQKKVNSQVSNTSASITPAPLMPEMKETSASSQEPYPDGSFFISGRPSVPNIPDGKPIRRIWDDCSRGGSGLYYSVFTTDLYSPPIHPRDCRIECYNKVELKRDGQLLFLPVIPPTEDSYYQQYLAKPFSARVPIKPGMRGSTLSGPFELGVGYSVGLKEPALRDNFVLYTDLGADAQNFILGAHYHQEHQMFFVKLLPLNDRSSTAIKTNVTVHVYCEYTPAPYPELMTLDELATLQQPKITDGLAQTLPFTIREDKALQFMNDSRMPILEKIKHLVEFVRDFKSDKPLVIATTTSSSWMAPPRADSFTNLLNCLRQRCGVCLHRSQISLLLLWQMGLDARMPGSPMHAWIEIRTKEGVLKRVDLGGGKIEYVHPSATLAARSRAAPMLKAENELIEKLKELKILTPVALGGGKFRYTLPPPPTPAVPAPRIQKIISQRPDDKKFYQEKIRALEQLPLFNWDLVVKAKTSTEPRQPMLIRLSQETDINTLRQQHFPHAMMGEYLYINHPKDFVRYLQTNMVTADKVHTEQPGPLAAIFKKGGTLLINWSNFSPKEQATYQSLWANPPRLGSHPIQSRAVNIIGLIAEDKPCLPSLAGHSLVCALPEAMTSKPVMADSKMEISPIHCDLFASATWQQLFIQDIVFKKEGKREFVDGVLLEAIKKGCPLVIHRPPKDPRFNELLTQINLEHRFFFNGQWIEVPETVHIKVVEDALTTMPKTLPFAALQATQESKSTTRCYITRNNWHTLAEQTVVAEDGYPLTVDGCLATEQDDTVFYVTDDISPAQWDQLASIIAKKFPPRQLPDGAPPFVFQLAPGVTPPAFWPETPVAEAKSSALSADVSEQNCVFTSNDTDFLVELLQQEHQKKDPVIIDLTADSGTAELIYSMRRSDDHGKLKLTTKLIFEQLKQGKTVILNGPINPDLMQALLPMFGPHPYLSFNGKNIPMPGRLLLVQPENAAKDIPEYITTKVRPFNQEDYRKALLTSREDSSEYKREKEIVDKLLHLAQLAPWQHRGSTMPADIGLRFTRLRRMKKLLLARTAADTRHNPLKDVWLNDYQKGSEEYAFLNVLCKYFFDESPRDLVRVTKLQGLLVDKDHEKNVSIWCLLNAFNGQSLRELFKEQAWLPQLKEGADLSSIRELIQYWKKHSAEERSKIIAAIETKAQILITKMLTSTSESGARQLVDKLGKKTNERVQAGLLSPLSPAITVQKGTPGTGKSHMLEAIITAQQRKDQKSSTKDEAPVASALTEKIAQVHVGVDAVEAWLTSTPTTDNISLLVLDEINTAKPNSLNWLKGLERDPPVVVYKGKAYPLTPQHRVLAASNPEYYPGRHYHEVLRNSGAILRRLPKPEQLQAWLVAEYKLPPVVAQHFLHGAELFKDQQPLRGYSFRDLQNLAQRYLMLVKQDEKSPGPKKSPAILVYEALRGEFARVIPDATEQVKYKQSLREQLKLPLPPEVVNPHGFPVGSKQFAQEMSDAHDGLQEALWIRQEVMSSTRDTKASASGGAIAYKRGLILQGDPGIGKNMLVQAMLTATGLSEGSVDEADPERHYLSVSASDPQFRAIATLAYQRGMILVVKNMEFLDEQDEAFLGNLLMNKHDNKQAERPGFFMIGIKTPSGGLSPALCNRTQILHIPKFSDTSWQLLAQRSGLSAQQAHAFTAAYWGDGRKSKSRHGHGFFSVMNKMTAPVGGQPDKRKRTGEDLSVGTEVFSRVVVSGVF